MSNQTLILLVVSLIIALLVALFQYIYKQKHSIVNYLLSFLRFISILGVLVLLINPKLDSVTYYEEKPKLIVAVDNSKSIKYLGYHEASKKLYSNLISNTELNDKFDIHEFKFGMDVTELDTLNFDDKQSNFSSLFKRYDELYKNSVAPIIVISDGNQTVGNDYTFKASKLNQAVFPVILGDTITYEDLSISQVNVNRFAYLKNKFPIEIITNYTGDTEVKSILRISSDSGIILSQPLELNKTTNSKILNFNLNATSVGVKSFKIELLPLSDEKNIDNNYKNFAVEIIDQKTNIALVSELIHPDLGVIKKTIESNEQRSVTILNPKEFKIQNTDYNLVILYSPNNSFKDVYDKIIAQKLSTFTVAGSSTDWNFLNKIQPFFNQDITNQTEEYQPSLNLNYSTFIVDNITFENYPPLKSEFGFTSFLVPEETLLFKSFNGITTQAPLLSTFEYNNQKHGLLNGEGLWKWRAHNFLEFETFENFDNVFGKLIQYLSSNKKRRRLSLDYKSFYNENESITINTQFFNKNYEFDENSDLVITYKNKDTQIVSTLPMLLNNTSYKIDLSGIQPGNYDFTVRSNDEPVSASGTFTILPYDVEKQFLNADITKLNAIASSTNGKTYFIDNSSVLVSDLVNDSRYATIQKSKLETISLIDYKYLLGLIALALSLEWFIRKYNGLI